MIRPIVLHGRNCEVTGALGKELSQAMGLEHREVTALGAKEFEQGFTGTPACVWSIPSEVMLDRGLRIRCLSNGFVVRVGKGTGWGVRGGNSGEGDLEGKQNARISELIEQEFLEGHASVDPDAQGVTRCVEIIKDLSVRAPVAVAAGESSYLVEVGQGIVEEGLSRWQWGSSVALYVTDENVRRLHGKRLGAAVASTGMRIAEAVLKPGEESKCFATLGGLFDCALDAGIDRTSWVIAAGGGVVTDISGLVAALWMRGVRWVAVPTTLLAMVDASVGGKTAVDHGMGKNAVGAFWQPRTVICDVDWLVTESARNYIGALAEVVKTALIGDGALLTLLEEQSERVVARDLGLMEEVVRRCVQVKARIVGLDPRERGLRAVLNLGHTVGHALEALGEYRRYTHGEAVSLGLVAALRLGEQQGYSSPELVERVVGLLGRLGLPVQLPKGELPGAAELLGHDKKRAGSTVRFVFAHGVEDVRTESVMLEDLREWVVGLAAQ